jgi:ERCC4-type nuclease
MLTVVDDREPPEVAETIERLISSAMVITERMQVGDIRIGPLTIERKTPSDFISSWFTGHLHTQIADMLTKTKRPVLFIHGDPSDRMGSAEIDRIHEHLLTLNMALPAYWFASLEEAVMWLADRARYIQKGEWIGYIKRPVRVLQPDNNPVTEVYLGLPHVGHELAQRLTEAFPTLDAFSRAVSTNPKWHILVEGIGTSKAACIHDVWLDGQHKHAKLAGKHTEVARDVAVDEEPPMVSSEPPEPKLATR